MRVPSHWSTLICGLTLSLLIPTKVLSQTDVQTTVRTFLQSWYVERKSPEELGSYIAKDNGFALTQSAQPPNAPRTAAPTDPVKALFTGAFTKGPVGAEAAMPKTLSDVIEYGPAKNVRAATAKTPFRCSLTSIEFAICKPEELPKGSVLPMSKPSGKDPVATYLWHLSQNYKDKLYIVLYSTKGAGLLRETAIQYWIQEGGSWKLAAFQGTNW